MVIERHKWEPTCNTLGTVHRRGKHSLDVAYIQLFDVVGFNCGLTDFSACWIHALLIEGY